MTSTSKVGDSYMVIDVVPTTSIASPDALLIETPEDGLTFSPCASAHRLVTRVTAAPVSTIMCPFVALSNAFVPASSHLDCYAPPIDATATSM